MLYQWKKGVNNISGATASYYIAKESGNYKVTVTNTVTGCSATTSTGTQVTKNALPVATVTPQGPTTFCAGQSVVIKANSGANITYQWRKNNVDIIGANSQSYTAFVAGSYKVQVTNSSTGCSKTSSGVTVVVNCRLAETNGSDFNVEAGPNPFINSITLSFDETRDVPMSVSIFSADGRLIEIQEAFPEENQLTLGSGWSEGVYFVRLQQGMETKTLRVIKL